MVCVPVFSRERSYPTAVEARGMRARGSAPRGPTAQCGPAWRGARTFPSTRCSARATRWCRACWSTSRDGCQAAWPGVVRVHHRCAVVGVDLRHRSLEVAPESDAAGAEAAARGAPFDLICACDGRNSPVRESAMSQDPSLTVTRHEDNVFFKTIPRVSLFAAGDVTTIRVATRC
ncbi:unnamed protein product [Prorocentrum cordatum]|uniref:Uncharacterized protein n=1 Tax=Prorocentrum cordatum TaxID=2364126 RepID=A0ABN9SH86_9DINO|nr:unnamed protein product [Polarella glacialis]